MERVGNDRNQPRLLAVRWIFWLGGDLQMQDNDYQDFIKSTSISALRPLQNRADPFRLQFLSFIISL